jgi:hypothetical protein
VIHGLTGSPQSHENGAAAKAVFTPVAHDPTLAGHPEGMKIGRVAATDVGLAWCRRARTPV